MRVCEELHGGSKTRFKIRQRTPAVGDLFAQRCLLFLQRADTILISLDDRAAVGFDHAVQNLADGAIYFLHLDLERLRPCGGGLDSPVPQIAEHGVSQIEQFGGGPHVTQQGFELLFDHIAFDRLAILIAAFALAEIISMAAITPGGPAPHKRLGTAPAQDELTKRKILIQIFARRNPRRFLDTLLDRLIGIEADKPLMPCWHQMELPLRDADKGSVEWTGQDFIDALDGQALALGFGIFRATGQKAHDFALGLKTTGRKAFQGFLNDRRQRLVTHQKLAVRRILDELVAERCWEAPIAAHRA